MTYVGAQKVPPQGESITVRAPDDTSLHVRARVLVNAPVIVFLHGYGMDGLVWHRQTAALLATRRVLTVDLRGHGRSDAPLDDSYGDARTWADDLAAVLDQTGVTRPVLVGWSYAGLAIADYLAVHGETGIAGTFLVPPLRKLGSSEVTELVSGDFLHAVIGMLADDVATATAAPASFVDLIADWDEQKRYERLSSVLSIPPAVRGAMGARVRDGDEVWGSVGKPLVIAYGDADWAVLPISSAQLAELTGAPSLVFPGAGHAPFVDDPARFSDELAAFVARVTS